jgi:hypothetical protein
MKYAVIAMVAIYLITFGCSPEAPEEKAEHAVEAKADVAAAHTVEKAEPVAAKEAHGEKPAVVEEKTALKADEQGEQNNQWEEIADNASNTVLSLMKEEEKPAKAPEAKETALQPVADNGAHPCFKEGEQEYPCPYGQPPVAEETSKDAAMEQMITATNNLVMATRKLVFATELMIMANQPAEEKAASPVTE